MNINDVLALALALIGGAVLGVFFFGGLWWTVKRLPISRSPALLIMGSFMARALVLVIGLYVIAGGRLLNLAAAMVGFLLARLLIVRRQSWKTEAMEVSHAAKP